MTQRPWWVITVREFCFVVCILAASWLIFGPPDWWGGPIIAGSFMASKYAMWLLFRKRP